MWLISVSDVFRGEKRCFALREASLCSCRSSDLYNCLRLLVLCCVVIVGNGVVLQMRFRVRLMENICIRISIRLIICLFWGVCKQFSCFNRTKSVNLHSFLIQQNCGYADKTV